MAKQSRTWTEVTEKLSSVEPLLLASNIPPDMASALSVHSSYPELFDAAFASAGITPARIAMAIASYERTLFPDQTPWDLYMAGDMNAMTANQIEGWGLFSEQTVCDNCHVPPLFTDNLSYNIGLRPALEDFGLQEVGGESEDFGRFKTPSLRNVGLRRALMHVGWITDVQDSVDFYNAESNETQHTQFTENQTDIPTGDSGIVREYSELSFFGPSASMQAIVVDFMANALTDPRVAAETFPFDRPTLRSELAPSPLKVMSFNIQAPGWNASRAETVSAVILDEGADVIGLQEALALQKSDLTELLGENYDFLSFQSDNSHPILLRKGVFNVIASGSMDEPVFCVIERYINYVVLQQISTDHQFIVHNSQFCPMVASFPAGELTAQQRNQNYVSVLAQTMEANLLQYALPMIALGDLNANSTSTSMQFLLQGGLLSDGLSTTLQLDDSRSIANPAVEKGAPIDWILATEDITVQKAAVVNSELAQQASDHSPVTATLIIEGEKSKGNIVGSTSGSLPTNSSFRGSVSDSSGNSDRSTFSSASVLSISATIYADPAEIGSSADVYTLVLYEGTYYMKDENGEFSIWDGTLDSLLSSSTIAVLSEVENLSVVSGLSGITGEFQIFVAYSIEDDIFQYNQSAVEFVVE